MPDKDPKFVPANVHDETDIELAVDADLRNAFISEGRTPPGADISVSEAEAIHNRNLYTDDPLPSAN